MRFVKYILKEQRLRRLLAKNLHFAGKIVSEI